MRPRGKDASFLVPRGVWFEPEETGPILRCIMGTCEAIRPDISASTVSTLSTLALE